MVAVIEPRIVQVSIGPQAGVGLKWSDLFITFNVEKTEGRTPNKAKVEIYNLSDTSKQWIEQPNQVIQVAAGETIPTQLFYGDIRKGKVETKRAGTNWITTIEALDGKRIIQGGYFSASYPPGTARTQILTDALLANGVVRGYIAPLPERTYESATTWSAALRDVLDELYAGELASWSIQDGSYQLIALGQPLPGNALVINEQTGMIGSPDRKDKGVSVSVLLAPAAKPGQGMAITSTTWTGSARITKLTQKGDSFGKSWQTDLVGVPIAT